jgi:hypothetical protein
VAEKQWHIASTRPGIYVGYANEFQIIDYKETEDKNQVAVWILRGWKVWLKTEHGWKLVSARTKPEDD